MPKGKEYKGVQVGMKSDEEVLEAALFPARNRRQKLQMITEQLGPRTVTAWSVLGLFARKYKSHTLAMFQEEVGTNMIALFRKGRLEYIEGVVAKKAVEGEEGD